MPLHQLVGKVLKDWVKTKTKINSRKEGNAFI